MKSRRTRILPKGASFFLSHITFFRTSLAFSFTFPRTTEGGSKRSATKKRWSEESDPQPPAAVCKSHTRKQFCKMKVSASVVLTLLLSCVAIVTLLLPPHGSTHSQVGPLVSRSEAGIKKELLPLREEQKRGTIESDHDERHVLVNRHQDASRSSESLFAVTHRGPDAEKMQTLLSAFVFTSANLQAGEGPKKAQDGNAAFCGTQLNSNRSNELATLTTRTTATDGDPLVQLDILVCTRPWLHDMLQKIFSIDSFSPPLHRERLSAASTVFSA
jgi:hypothetical protein